MSDIETLADQAYSAWELRELAQAAEYFLQAAELEAQAAAGRSKWASPDYSFSYRIRAAFCLWENGDFDRARATLQEATRFDWKGSRLWADRYDGEKAFACLLEELAAANDRAGFQQLWRQATDRGNELKLPFPSIIPVQKKMLAACTALQYREGAQQVIGNISAESLAKDHELRILLQQARHIPRRKWWFW